MDRVNNKYMKLYLENNPAQVTRMYASIVNRLFDYMGFEDPTLEEIKSITVTDANAFMNFAKETYKLQNSTLNKYMKACSSFFRFLRRSPNHLLTFNPFDTDEGAVRFKEKQFSSGIRITDENLKLLNRYFSNDRSLLGTRNYIIFLILVSTGMRRAEVTRIKLGDFFNYDGYCGLNYVGKGEKPLITMISHQVKAVIDEYVSRQCWDWTMEDQWLFPSSHNFGKHITTDMIYVMLKEAQEKSGIDQDISSHDFRHTYVTKSLELGQSLEETSKRVGHASVQTTKRYDHTNVIFKGNPADDILGDIDFTERKVVRLVV